VTDHQPFKLNLNHDGPNVVHKAQSTERCNLDDASRVVFLDKLGYEEVKKNGTARECEYCFPLSGVV
jgi:hypothetical protein